ncbi:MAG: hypothetical protein QHI38_14070, partial [Armatimonadota bacterium]|nr:hypothetical protein [Armatimonadota bacterium]
VAISRANADVTQKKGPPVPMHLRDASYPGAKELGHGKDYLYPHDYPEHYVEQEYLPPGTKSGPYYEPTEHGHEAKFKQRLERLRKRHRLQESKPNEETTGEPPTFKANEQANSLNHESDGPQEK